jgi:hypothetical protein
MRYASSVFPSLLQPNVYDVVLVWQRERSFVEVGSPEPSFPGVIKAGPLPFAGAALPWLRLPAARLHRG